MSSKRKFSGVPFIPKQKCIDCEHLEQCKNTNNSLTIKLIVLECESFYYIFKQLEEFEKLPALGESREKNQESIDKYEKQHEGIQIGRAHV